MVDADFAGCVQEVLEQLGVDAREALSRVGPGRLPALGGRRGRRFRRRFDDLRQLVGGRRLDGHRLFPRFVGRFGRGPFVDGPCGRRLGLVAHRRQGHQGLDQFVVGRRVRVLRLRPGRCMDVGDGVL